MKRVCRVAGFHFRKYKNFFSIRVRQFHFLKYKEFSWGWIFLFLGLGLESARICFQKYKKRFLLRKYTKSFRLRKHKKSFLLRKYKNFFNIRARNFNSAKYKEFFGGRTFFALFGLGLEVVPGSP